MNTIVGITYTGVEQIESARNRFKSQFAENNNADAFAGSDGIYDGLAGEERESAALRVAKIIPRKSQKFAHKYGQSSEQITKAWALQLQHTIDRDPETATAIVNDMRKQWQSAAAFAKNKDDNSIYVVGTTRSEKAKEGFALLSQHREAVTEYLSRNTHLPKNELKVPPAPKVNTEESTEGVFFGNLVKAVAERHPYEPGERTKPGETRNDANFVKARNMRQFVKDQSEKAQAETETAKPLNRDLTTEEIDWKSIKGFVKTSLETALKETQPKKIALVAHLEALPKSGPETDAYKNALEKTIREGLKAGKQFLIPAGQDRTIELFNKVVASERKAGTRVLDVQATPEIVTGKTKSQKKNDRLIAATDAAIRAADEVHTFGNHEQRNGTMHQAVGMATVHAGNLVKANIWNGKTLESIDAETAHTFIKDSQTFLSPRQLWEQENIDKIPTAPMMSGEVGLFLTNLQISGQNQGFRITDEDIRKTQEAGKNQPEMNLLTVLTMANTPEGAKDMQAAGVAPSVMKALLSTAAVNTATSEYMEDLAHIEAQGMELIGRDRINAKFALAKGNLDLLDKMKTHGAAVVVGDQILDTSFKKMSVDDVEKGAAEDGKNRKQALQAGEAISAVKTLLQETGAVRVFVQGTEPLRERRDAQSVNVFNNLADGDLGFRAANVVAQNNGLALSFAKPGSLKKVDKEMAYEPNAGNASEAAKEMGRIVGELQAKMTVFMGDKGTTEKRSPASLLCEAQLKAAEAADKPMRVFVPVGVEMKPNTREAFKAVGGVYAETGTTFAVDSFANFTKLYNPLQPNPQDRTKPEGVKAHEKQMNATKANITR